MTLYEQLAAAPQQMRADDFLCNALTYSTVPELAQTTVLAKCRCWLSHCRGILSCSHAATGPSVSPRPNARSTQGHVVTFGVAVSQRYLCSTLTITDHQDRMVNTKLMSLKLSGPQGTTDLAGRCHPYSFTASVPICAQRAWAGCPWQHQDKVAVATQSQISCVTSMSHGYGEVSPDILSIASQPIS